MLKKEINTFKTQVLLCLYDLLRMGGTGGRTVSSVLLLIAYSCVAPKCASCPRAEFVAAL